MAIIPVELDKLSNPDVIAHRLHLWVSRASEGLVIVSYESERDLANCLQLFEQLCNKSGMPVATVSISERESADECVKLLEEQLALYNSIVNVTGFTAYAAKGFEQQCVAAINCRREYLLARPLKQIWWISESILPFFRRFGYDLYSWARMRLRLEADVLSIPSFDDDTIIPTKNEVSERVQRATRMLEALEPLPNEPNDDSIRIFFEAVRIFEEVSLTKNIKSAAKIERQVLVAINRPDAASLGEVGINELSVSPELARVLRNLASDYRGLGRMSEATALAQRSVDILTDLVGEGHPETSESMARLARIYYESGRSESAYEIEHRLLEINSAINGNIHPNSIRCMNNMAAILVSLNQMPQALELQERIRDICVSALGKDHQEALRANSNLAATYCKIGRYQDAIELGELVAASRSIRLGGDHPFTLASMNNLAAAYFAAGHLKEALQLQEKVLEARTLKFGGDQRETLEAANNLALTHCELGNFSEAKKIQEWVFEQSIQNLGSDHPDTLNKWSNLAVIYHKSGRPQDAIDVMGRVYEKAIEV